MPLPDAVAACYRAQFLNATLPGGVLGDVHRAVRHGLDIGNVGLGVRAVVLERVAGQAVQVAVAVIVLCAFPSPVRPYLPALSLGLGAVGLGAVVTARALGRGRSARWVTALRTLRDDLRYGLRTRRIWVGVLAASTVVAACHLAMFVLAARTAGATAPLAVLLPLTMAALMAMVLPVNVAGWGPREGVAAWVFGAAGLTVTQGVATSVTYGVLVLLASLPGAAVLVARWAGRVPAVVRRPEPGLSGEPTLSPVGAFGPGGARG
jgi:uncharacterized membrane protein YbhN (UPF0104 family)